MSSALRSTRHGHTGSAAFVPSSIDRSSTVPSDLRSPAALGYALLFLMVFAPTAYPRLKALLLALVLAMLGARALHTRRLGLHSAVVGRTVFFSSAGLFFVLVGSINDNPGALAMLPLFVGWPIVYAVLVGGLDDETRLTRIIQLLVLATIAIDLSIYMFLLREAGILPTALSIPLDLGQRVNAAFTEFDAYSMASLLFLVPFLVGALMLWPRDERMPVPRGVLWVAVGLSAPLVLLSGRRGLWIAVAVAPVIALVFWTWLRPQRRRRKIRWRRWSVRAGVIGVCFVLVMSALTGFTLGGLWSTFQQGFNFNSGDAAFVPAFERGLQFDALVRGWSSSPLIGNGLGAVSTEVVRSHDQPWAYELAYIALLFTTGILGASFYAYGLAWIVGRGRAMARAGARDAAVVLSVLVGTAGMVVANATNPYLTKFDGLWTLFLPIAFINQWLLTRDRSRPPSPGRSPHPS